MAERYSPGAGPMNIHEMNPENPRANKKPRRGPQRLAINNTNIEDSQVLAAIAAFPKDRMRAERHIQIARNRKSRDHDHKRPPKEPVRRCWELTREEEERYIQVGSGPWPDDHPLKRIKDAQRPTQRQQEALDNHFGPRNHGKKQP